MSKRVLVVYGTRPEAIKMVPLIAELRSQPDIEVVIAVTGQHREMLDQINQLFGIAPDHDLDLMVSGASLSELGSRALEGVAAVIERERPDCVVVQGDTTSAFMAGLAAFYARVPVVHLEAGLRTGNLAAPFPEEANRALLTQITALHLAPTTVAAANLAREGVDRSTVVITGNTVIDALLIAVDRPPVFENVAVAELVDSGQPFVLVTAHRRESWGEPMRQAMYAIHDVAVAHPGLRWLVPMHRNPTVRADITGALGDLDGVLLTEPLNYHQFCHAMKAAKLLVTDSGGVQEEGPALGKPVLVMRETTERPEGISAGVVRLIGTARHEVERGLTELLDDPEKYGEMARAVSPFGDGHAAPRAAAAILALLGLGERAPDFTVV